MKNLLIQGGHGLAGTVRIQGAKNSVLLILAATLLAGDVCTLYNVPHLADVDTAVQILRSIGAEVQVGQNTLAVAPPVLLHAAVPPSLMSAMRSSVFFLAPLLAVAGSASVSAPGGCPLGARPIDIHLDGLSHMGAEVLQQGDTVRLTAPHGLRGTDYTLRFPSVGATETMLLAAVTARGISVIRNVATEPEIVDLAEFLSACGAQITGAGTRTLRIQGVRALHGAHHRVCADRIAAATVLCAVAGCGGRVTITDCRVPHLSGTLRVLMRAGCAVRQQSLHRLTLVSPGQLRAAGTWYSAVYPGLPTDVMPLLAAALLRAQGSVQLIDTVFGARFACAEGFAAMGAEVQLEKGTLTMRGVPALHSAAAQAVDLRGGAALVLAALQAQGESCITGTHHIARGYEDIAALFAPLGADIYWQD